MEALGVNVPGLVAQLVNFLLLLYLLRRFAFPLIMRMFDERAARIREGLERAEAMRREGEQTRADVEGQLAEARRESQNIVAQAAQVGERLQEEAREEARRQTEQILGRARAQIQAERDQAVAELRAQFAGLAVAAAERIIRRSLDERAHRDLSDEVLASSGPESRN